VGELTSSYTGATVMSFLYRLAGLLACAAAPVVWLTLCFFPQIMFATRLPVRTFTTADGLPRDAADCLFIDSKNYLWVCTAEGVSRYDGYQFVNYGVAQGLPHRSVNAFLETREGLYLAGTDHGLSRLDPLTPPGSPHKFVSIPPGKGVPGGGVRAIAQTPDGRVLAGTFNGVYTLDPSKRGPLELGFLSFGARQGVAATAFAFDDRGSVWIGTSRGLACLHRDGHITWIEHPTVAGESVPALVMDRQHRLWVGTFHGLHRFLAGPGAGVLRFDRSFDTQSGLPTDRIHSLMSSSRTGSFWVGTALALCELVRDAPGAERFRSYGTEQGLVGRVVLALAEDPNGNLWAGVDHGLARVTPGGFATYTPSDGIDAPSIVDILEASFGKKNTPPRQLRRSLVAVGNEASGLVFHELRDGRFVAVRPRYPARLKYFGWATNQAVLQDRQGEWWLAAGDALLHFPRVDRLEDLALVTPTAVYAWTSGWAGADFFRVYEDRRGDIWVSSAGVPRLSRWDRKREIFVRYSPADCPGIASAFAEDRAGNLWIGFSNDTGARKPTGLLRFHDGRFERFTAADGVPTGWILALYLDHAGRLWIGSGDGGLGRIDHPEAAQPRIVTYAQAQGLSSATVRALTEDASGWIYAATPRGLDALNPETGSFRHLTAAQGLVSGTPAAAYRDSAGRLWFGTSLGISHYVPGPELPASPPRLLITGLAVNGNPQTLADPGVTQIPELRLAPDQRQLQFDFVGTGAATDEVLHYQYRLVGADGRWSNPSASHSVNYAALTPGRYRFEVRLAGQGGLGESATSTASFTIRPPFWQSWWFILSCLTIVAALTYLAHRYNLGRQLELERIRIRIATDLHDDLGASLTRVAILSDLAGRNASGPAGNGAVLGEIADTARELLDGLSDLVWSIDPRRDDMPSMVRRLRHFASSLLEAKGVHFGFEIGPEAERLALRLDQRRHLFLIFKEAIQNAARHSQCHSLLVSLTVVRGQCVARVKDDGRGLPNPAPEAGNGLDSMRARAKALNGKLNIVSGDPEGVSVEVSFPAPATKGAFRSQRSQGGRIFMLLRERLTLRRN